MSVFKVWTGFVYSCFTVSFKYKLNLSFLFAFSIFSLFPLQKAHSNFNMFIPQESTISSYSLLLLSDKMPTLALTGSDL